MYPIIRFYVLANQIIVNNLKFFIFFFKIYRAVSPLSARYRQAHFGVTETGLFLIFHNIPFLERNRRLAACFFLSSDGFIYISDGVYVHVSDGLRETFEESFP